MSRGRANHHLYLARLLIDGWEALQLEGRTPATTLDAAYAPAVREQLLTAYGWYLLAVSDPAGDATGPPPRCCADLPAPAPGRALAGELREFARLEREGWLASLLAPLPEALPGRGRQPGNLLAAERELPDAREARGWHSQLLATVSRMNDSLEES
jgi:hypothetical protein